MADDRDDDDAPDYRGIDGAGLSLDTLDDDGSIFDDGRTITSLGDGRAAVGATSIVDEEGRLKTLMELGNLSACLDA